MTFGSTFGRTFSPTFQPKSQAKAVVSGDTWWDLNGTITSCVAAWQAKGAASYAASKVNLANSGTYDLAEIGGGAVTWSDSVGWSGFSTLSRCLDTQIANAITKTWSVIVRCAGVTADNTLVLGGYDGYQDSCYIAYFTATGWRFELMIGAPTNVAGSDSAVLAMAGSDIYVDGTDVANFASQSTNTLARSPYLGAQHYTSATQFTNGSIQAAAFYNATLTSTQIANLTTAINLL